MLVAPSLSAFPITNSHCADVFFSNKPVLFLLRKAIVYGAAVVVNENNIVTDLAAFWYKAKQLMDRLVVLLFLYNTAST